MNKPYPTCLWNREARCDSYGDSLHNYAWSKTAGGSMCQSLFSLEGVCVKSYSVCLQTLAQVSQKVHHI